MEDPQMQPYIDCLQLKTSAEIRYEDQTPGKRPIECCGILYIYTIDSATVEQ